MTESFLDSLETELTHAGIGGRRRERILAEFADHLDCDPGADLGDPHALATQFADELGTSFARNAAFAAFGALAITGALLVIRILTMGAFNRVDGSAGDTLGLLGAVVAAQVSFAAGTLALLRAIRVRRQPTIPAAEARIIARRAGLGLAAGALAILAVPLRASASQHTTSAGSTFSIVAMVIGVAVLLLAAAPLIRAARLQPSTAGDAPDLLADIAPLGNPARTPNRVAVLLASGLFLVVTVAGVAAGDPYDGAFRGLFEGLACYGGFVVLGKYLGLR
jgi:hypothetical protein